MHRTAFPLGGAPPRRIEPPRGRSQVAHTRLDRSKAPPLPHPASTLLVRLVPELPESLLPVVGSGRHGDNPTPRDRAVHGRIASGRPCGNRA